MRAVGASTRVFSLLDREPAIPTNTGIPVPTSLKRGGVIKFENVSFEYPSRKDVKVLDGFNLTIPVGGSTAIVSVTFFGLRFMI